MNSKDYKLLAEAYASVYSEQQRMVGQHPGKSPDKATRDKYETQSRRGTAPKGVGVPDKSVGYGQLKQDVDMFELVKGHLMSEGYADNEKAALAIMANMSEQWRDSIVEQSRAGFRSDGRYQNADGSTTGPVMGAIKSILSGNLPKSRTVVPPTSQPSITVTQTKKPTKKTPYSKTDSGELTNFGAGGGKAKMKETGMSVAEVEKLGRKNRFKSSNPPRPSEGGPRLPGRDM